MATRPITNGATVTMPTASDANQWYQIVRADADDIMEKQKASGTADPRDGASKDRRRSKSEHAL